MNTGEQQTIAALFDTARVSLQPLADMIETARAFVDQQNRDLAPWHLVVPEGMTP